MNITKETKLKDLIGKYPWLKEEIVKVNKKFKLCNSPMGKIFMKKADIYEMSKRSGQETDEIIDRLTELIKLHK